MRRWLLLTIALLVGCSNRENIPRDLYDASVVPHTPTPTPTVIPPTNTLEPTFTPTSIPTQNPPTPLPIPTAATRSVSVTEQAYTQAVQEQVNILGEALGEIGELSPQYDGSDDWKLSMAIQMALVKVAHQKLTELTPPDGYEAFHVLLLNATSDCDEAMDVMARGIDNDRISDVENAGALMGSCGEKTVPALAEMRRLQNR